jgi:signal transduction histidine kinase
MSADLDGQFRNVSVVVVDDQRVPRMSIARLISKIHRSLEVVQFEHGSDAVDWVRTHDVGLVITDFAMPNMDGIQLVTAMRQLPRMGYVPILMTTAVGDASVKKAALEAGATDFLTTPIDPDEGRVRCRNLLQLYLSVRRNDEQARAVDALRADAARREREQLRNAQQRAEATARHAIVAKTTFLAMASHELRTPLHSIVTFVELIQRRMSKGEDVQEALQSLRVAAEGLHSVAHDLGEFARLEAGYVKRAEQVVDLSTFAFEVADLFRVEADRKGIDLSVSSEINVRAVMVDRVRLRQIAINLVGNAVKYTEFGCVRLQLKCEQQEYSETAKLTLIVSDTGIGISAETCEKMMEPFVRATDVAVSAQEGLGLGLAIVSSLVTLLNASLAVESTPHMGSRFLVTMDVAIQKGVSGADERLSERTELHGPLRVLVIDDDVRAGQCRVLLRGQGVDLG